MMGLEYIPQKKVKITYLKTGDKVVLLNSFGSNLGEFVIERETNFYVFADGKKYWKKGVDGKHRYSGNYTMFLMNEKDAAVFMEPVKNSKSINNGRTGKSHPLQGNRW